MDCYRLRLDDDITCGVRPQGLYDAQVCTAVPCALGTSCGPLCVCRLQNPSECRRLYGFRVGFALQEFLCTQASITFVNWGTQPIQSVQCTLCVYPRFAFSLDNLIL